MKKAKFTIRPNTWVTLIMVGFLAWALIITGVTFFAAKASYIESQKPKVTQCRDEFGRKRSPDFCSK